MEYHKKVVALVAGLLVLLVAYGIYIKLNAEKGATPIESTDAEKLLINGVMFGGNISEYRIGFMEDNWGYQTTYIVSQTTGKRKITIINPLSEKTMYFSANKTVLCITYQDQDEVCSDITNSSDLNAYQNELKGRFYDESLTQRNRFDLDLLLAGKYLKLDSKIEKKTIREKECNQVKYVIDFTNATINDAARFGIGLNSPKVFNWSMCIAETGLVWQKTYSNVIDGRTYRYELSTLSFMSVVNENIGAPTNISGDEAIVKLYYEKQDQAKLRNCYIDKQGDGLDKCLFDAAIMLEKRNICSLTSARKDRCYVALVPILKDETLCNEITSSGFKDDCFIELAGAYKNNSYCSRIQNMSKTITCNEVALSIARNETITEIPPSSAQTNVTVNISASGNTSEADLIIRQLEIAEALQAAADAEIANGTGNRT